MSVFRGTVTGSISGMPYNIASTIKSWYLTNNTGGSITVNVSLVNNLTGEATKIFNRDIAANESVSDEVEIIMPYGWTLYIATSGSLDYWFSIL